MILFNTVIQLQGSLCCWNPSIGLKIRLVRLPSCPCFVIWQQKWTPVFIIIRQVSSRYYSNPDFNQSALVVTSSPLLFSPHPPSTNFKLSIYRYLLVISLLLATSAKLCRSRRFCPLLPYTSTKTFLTHNMDSWYHSWSGTVSDTKITPRTTCSICSSNFGPGHGRPPIWQVAYVCYTFKLYTSLRHPCLPVKVCRFQAFPLIHPYSIDPPIFWSQIWTLCINYTLAYAGSLNLFSKEIKSSHIMPLLQALWRGSLPI
jgi:hypothetical protein